MLAYYYNFLLEFLIFRSSLLPPFCFRLCIDARQKRSQNLIELGSQGNALTVQTTLSSASLSLLGHICPDKILFMFWKALSFSSPYYFYLKGVLDRRAHPKYWVIYSPLLFFFPFFTFIRKFSSHHSQLMLSPQSM